MPDHREPDQPFSSDGLGWNSNDVSRRTLLRRGAAAGLAISSGSLLAACGSDGGEAASGSRTVAGIPGEIKAKSVVYAEYGGTTRAAYQSVFYDSFHAATGVKVVGPDADEAQFELMARRKRSRWDATMQAPVGATRWVKEGLLDKLPSWIPRSDFDIDPSIRDYLSGGFYAAYVLSYLNNVYKNRKPESWADFFDTKRFPGKRAFVGTDFDAYFEIALLADGVPAEQLLPLDYDRAIAKLDTIRKSLLIGASNAAVQQLLASGTASMALQLNGRAVPLTRTGTDLGISWNQAIVQGHTGPVMPKDAPHPDTAHALIYWMTDPARQAAFTRITGYGPTNAKALELLDKETLALLPNSAGRLELSVRIDPARRGQERDEYVKRWTKWLAA